MRCRREGSCAGSRATRTWWARRAWAGIPSESVVDKFGRTHDIANLFVCDGSVMPTQGSANPGLTIQALAARTADYLIAQGDTIFSSNRRSMEEPKIRYDLSPPYTKFKGNPRIG